MAQTRRRFLAATGGAIIAVRAASAQTARPSLPSVELGEPVETLAIRNVTVIDMAGGSSIRGATVLLQGSRIASVGASVRTTVPPGAAVVNGAGKFLIPGLWDMHAHPNERMLPLFVANGITGVRWMNAPPVSIDLRTEIASDRRLGPQLIVGLYLNGPALGQSGDDWWIVSNTERAKAAVRRGRREGYDFIKVYNLLPREAYFAIADEAKRQGLPFAGHIPFSVSAAEASDAGQRSVEHLTGLLDAASNRDEETRSLLRSADANRQGAQLDPELLRPVEQMYKDTFSSEMLIPLLARFKRNQTWQTPTLTLRRMAAFVNGASLRNDPRLKYIPAGIKAGWEMAANGFERRTPTDVDLKTWRWHKELELVGMLKRAGVPVLAGTDVPTPFSLPGFGLHDELTLLAQAGLTPAEALQTATINPARFLGKEADLGTITKGKIADLVLLDADPLANISNTQRISAVITGGRVYRRPALDKMLEFAEADARG